MSHVICLLFMIFVWPNANKKKNNRHLFLCIGRNLHCLGPGKKLRVLTFTNSDPSASWNSSVQWIRWKIGRESFPSFGGLMIWCLFRWAKIPGGSCFLGERQRVSWYRRLKYHWWYRSILLLMGMMQPNQRNVAVNFPNCRLINQPTMCLEWPNWTPKTLRLQKSHISQAAWEYGGGPFGMGVP